MKKLILLPCLALLGSPASAGHFAYRVERVDGQERGVISSHRMDLFVITTTAGGFSPARRAQIIAGRLDTLSEAHEFSPEMFSVGFRNGMVIIQQQQHGEHLPHTVVTIDPRLAGKSGVERLARWWLALLRDHVALAVGQVPTDTIGTPVGEVFQKLYAQLETPPGRVTGEEIEDTLLTLTQADLKVFYSAASKVPDTFDPDRVVVLIGPSAHRPAEGNEEQHGEETGEEPEEQHEEPPTGAEPGDLLIRLSGNYKVVFATDPKSIPVQQETTLSVQIRDISNDDADVKGAVVNGWLSREGEEPGDPIPAVFNDREAAYTFRTTFPGPGEYHFAVGAMTASGDILKVEFSFEVVQAGPPKPPQEPSEEPSERRGGPSFESVLRYGDYILALKAEFAQPSLRGAGKVTIKITDAETSAPLSGLNVTGRFITEGQRLSDVEPADAEAGDEAGVYLWHVVFPADGKYRLAVDVEAADGETFRVQFYLSVGSP